MEVVWRWVNKIPVNLKSDMMLWIFILHTGWMYFFRMSKVEIIWCLCHNNCCLCSTINYVGNDVHNTKLDSWIEIVIRILSRCHHYKVNDILLSNLRSVCQYLHVGIQDRGHLISLTSTWDLDKISGCQIFAKPINPASWNFSTTSTT